MRLTIRRQRRGEGVECHAFSSVCVCVEAVELIQVGHGKHHLDRCAGLRADFLSVLPVIKEEKWRDIPSLGAESTQMLIGRDAPGKRRLVSCEQFDS